MECTFITAEKERGMKEKRPQKRLLQFVTLSLLSLLAVVVMSGESYAALQCYSCHGNGTDDALPLDTPYTQPASYRNITTGAVKGNHQTHLSGLNITSGNQAMCSRCHNNSNYTSSHRSGTITLNKAINASPAGATYTSTGIQDGGTYVFKNQTSVPVLGTCSNVNCHFETVTPTWGSDPAATMNCGACHASSPSTGSHNAHLATGSHATYSCTTCHANRANFQHATSAGNAGRNIDLNGTSMAGATYTGSNYQILPSQAGTRLFGSCGTVYCHSSGQPNGGGAGNPVYKTGYLWGDATRTCADCHASIPTTGSHTKHYAYDTNCGQCHAGATSSTMTSTTHVDGNINVNAAGVTYSEGVSSARGNGYGSCSASTCHANPVGPGSVASPTWGVLAANCTACHTGVNTITALGPVTGNHTKHMGLSGAACTQCHNANTSATTMPTVGHLDGDIDVANVGYAANKTKGTAGTTCASASCHVSPTSTAFVTTPAWGTTGNGCAACHTGGNAITALGPVTGNHTKHMARATVACTDCHAAGTSATTVPSTGHTDGDIDVTVGGYTANKTKGSAYTTCSNVSCHNGPASNPFTAAAINWNATPSCTNCHAYPPANASHTGISGNCNSCHSDVAANGTTISIPAQHLDGKVQGGKCNSCHGYPPVQSMIGMGVNASYSTAKLQNYSGGGGVHNVAGHLPLLLKSSQYTGTNSFTPCLACHPSSSHNEGFSSFSTHHVQVVVDTKFKFDKNRAIVYTSQKSADVANRGKCSNVECHFQKSPKWSTQTYTNR